VGKSEKEAALFFPDWGPSERKIKKWTKLRQRPFFCQKSNQFEEKNKFKNKKNCNFCHETR